MGFFVVAVGLPVELTCQGDAGAVERAVEVFGKVLTERFEKLQIHSLVFSILVVI